MIVSEKMLIARWSNPSHLHHTGDCLKCETYFRHKKYMCVCVYIYIYSCWPTIVEGNLNVPFSKATTLDPFFIKLSVKQGSIKYHFLSLWYDSTWDWTPVLQTIGEHFNNYSNGCVYIYIYIYIYMAITDTSTKCITIVHDNICGTKYNTIIIMVLLLWSYSGNGTKSNYIVDTIPLLYVILRLVKALNVALSW